MMKSVLLRVWVLCWLVMVWILLWGNASPGNMLGGLLVALVVTLLLPLPRVPVEGWLHPLSLLKLILMIVHSLVTSSIQVAWLAVKPGPPPLTAVLRAHVDVKSDLVLALAANIINLTPGTIALEIDQTRRIIYVHVIDVGSERTLQHYYRHIDRMQRLLVATFERTGDRVSADRENS